MCEIPLSLSIVTEILASTVKQKRDRKRDERREGGRKTSGERKEKKESLSVAITILCKAISEKSVATR